LQRLSSWVRALTVLGALALLVVPVAFWLSPDWVRVSASDIAGLQGHPVTVDARAQALGAACSLPGVAVGLWMLWQLWQLFGQYRAGRVFELRALGHLRGFAWALLAGALLAPLQRTALALVLTLGNPPGQRLLVLNLGWDDYLGLLTASVLLAIATVMAQAVALAEENGSFV
jgi:hypothetical protein